MTRLQFKKIATKKWHINIFSVKCYHPRKTGKCKENAEWGINKETGVLLKSGMTCGFFLHRRMWIMKKKGAGWSICIIHDIKQQNWNYELILKLVMLLTTLGGDINTLSLGTGLISSTSFSFSSRLDTKTIVLNASLSRKPIIQLKRAGCTYCVTSWENVMSHWVSLLYSFWELTGHTYYPG